MSMFNTVFEFILYNRGGSTFVDWTKDEILDEMNKHIAKGTLLVAVIKHENDHAGYMAVEGVIMYDINNPDKSLHISHIICKSKEAFKYYLEYYKNHFAGYKLQAYRRGNFIRYSNTDKLVRRLSNKLFYV